MTRIARPDFDATLASLTQTLVNHFLSIGFPTEAVEMYKKVRPRKTLFHSQI